MDGEGESVFACLLAREFQVFESHANFFLNAVPKILEVFCRLSRWPRFPVLLAPTSRHAVGRAARCWRFTIGALCARRPAHEFGAHTASAAEICPLQRQ